MTLCEQHISAAEFWGVVGKSGVDGVCWLDGDRKSFGKWFCLTYFVSLWCFLGSEIDIAIWFRRPSRCLVVAYVQEKTQLFSSTEVRCNM